MSDVEIEDIFLSGLERMYPAILPLRRGLLSRVASSRGLRHPDARVFAERAANGHIGTWRPPRHLSADRQRHAERQRDGGTGRTSGPRPAERARPTQLGRPVPASTAAPSRTGEPTRHALAGPRQSVVIPEDPRRSLVAVLSVVPRPRRAARPAIPRRARPADHLVRGGSETRRRPSNHASLAAVASAGHEIGNHSYLHEPWLHRYPPERLDEELRLAEEAIEEATGQQPKGFRGPGFSVSENVLLALQRRGYRYDASTLPTFIGPLARAFYFRNAADLTPEEQSRARGRCSGPSERARARCDPIVGVWTVEI